LNGTQRENQYGGQNQTLRPKWLPIVLNLRRSITSVVSHILIDVERTYI